MDIYILFTFCFKNRTYLKYLNNGTIPNEKTNHLRLCRRNLRDSSSVHKVNNEKWPYITFVRWKVSVFGTCIWYKSFLYLGNML